jgi:drug/metabolite transporter (DMT)-like permease
MQFVGALALSLYIPFSGELSKLEFATPGDWGWIILTILCNIAASFALYRAFSIGKLSLVSPIAASYGAITAVLSFLSGESLSQLRFAGIAITVLGVVLASISSGDAQAGSATGQVGVLWALSSALGFALTFWLMGFRVIPVFGGVTSVWFSRIFTILILASLAFSVRRKLTIPAGISFWQVLAVGVLDTTAFLCNNLGLTTDQVSVVTVLASSFSAVTVLMAWIWLRESLRYYQWAGVAFLLAGVALVSI